MQRWEYHVLWVSKSSTDSSKLSYLKEAGDDGWELAHIDNSDDNYLEYTFKRPKEST